MRALKACASVKAATFKRESRSVNLLAISFAKPVLTRPLSISLFAACAALSPDGQETQAGAAVGTQEVVLEQEIEAQQMRLEQEIEAQQMRLEQALKTEKEDPEWSQRAETSWTQVFQQEVVKEELKGIRLRDIECRTTLCRVELAPTDPAQGATAFEKDVGLLLLFSPWRGSGFGRIENPDGQAPAAMIYVAREGHTLP
jgi:hypothetical protein